MAGVTSQRTNVYNEPDINARPAKSLWKTEKLFTIKPYSYERFEMGPFRADVPIPNYHKYSAPVLADGVLYFSVYNGTGYIVGQYASDGAPRTRLKVGSSLSPLTIASGTIYVGASNGRFHAFDINTARDKWAVDLDGYSFDFTSPLVASGIVYFGGSKASIDEKARPAGIFYAVDAATGRELWVRKVKGNPTSAAVFGDTVLFGDDDQHLFALDSWTGQEKWTLKTGSNIYTPSIMGEAVFFSDNNGNLNAVNLKTGQQKWKTKKPAKVGTMQAVDKNSVYFGGEDNSLYAVDAATGEERWRFKTNKSCSTPVLTGSLVYIGCFDNILYAVDAATGQEKWRYKSSEPISDYPVIAGGTIYFLDTAAHLYALR
jgi:eukaryotic-like serine/threonine-protein kinase